MAAYSYLVLIIGISVCCLEMFDMVNGKVCYKINNKSNTERHHSIYNKVYFCCDNSESLNEGCIECKIGFLSVHGESCKPCPRNSFGRKCSQYCNCEIYESCHNVFGCITVNTTKDRREKATTITNIQTTTYPTGRDGDEDEVVTLYMLPDNAVITSEIDKRELINTSIDIHYKVNNVFLYTVCTGSIALIMVLASSTLTFYRREQSKRNNSKNDKQGGDNKGRSTIITV